MVTDVVIDILKESDYYKIMGLTSESEVGEVNKTYKLLAKKYHPDLHSSSNQANKDQVAQIFSKITTAYNTLKDVEKRKNYDYELKLRNEYEKTLNSTTFSFGKPGSTEIKININNNAQGKQQKGASASEETKNEQAEKMYNSALEKYRSGNVDAAILDLQTAVVLAKVAKYHSCLGLFMNEKGWTGYAQSHFKTALNIDPKDKLALKHSAKPEDKEEVKKTKVEISKEKGLFDKIRAFFANIFSKK